MHSPPPGGGNWAEAGSNKKQLVANSRLLDRVSEAVGRSILYHLCHSLAGLGATARRQLVENQTPFSGNLTSISCD